MKPILGIISILFSINFHTTKLPYMWKRVMNGKKPGKNICHELEMEKREKPIYLVVSFAHTITHTIGTKL